MDDPASDLVEIHPAPKQPVPGVVLDTTELLEAKKRRDASALRRRGRIRLVWSPRLIAEFTRNMTEFEMELRQQGKARRDHPTWKRDFREMMDQMEADYEVVSSQPAGEPPPHVERNPKDAHVWWTAINGKASYIVTSDDRSRPKGRAAEGLPVQYLTLDELVEIV